MEFRVENMQGSDMRWGQELSKCLDNFIPKFPILKIYLCIIYNCIIPNCKIKKFYKELWVRHEHGFGAAVG